MATGVSYIMFSIIFIIFLIIRKMINIFRKDPARPLTSKLFSPMRHWAKYRLNATATTMLLLVLSVLETIVFGFFLYWGAETEDVGATLLRAWNSGRLLEILARTLRDGRLGEAVLYGIQTVFEVLEGNGSALRAGFPHHRIWTFSLCFCIPVLTVSTVILFVIDFLPKWLPPRKEYFIFAQADNRSIMLAENLTGQKPRGNSCAIFLRTEKEHLSPESLAQLKKIGARVYPYSETDLMHIHWCLKHKIIRFFFLSPDTDLNFSRMKDFLEDAEEDTLFGLPRFISKREKEEMKKSEATGIFRQELYLLSETDSAPLLIDSLRRNLCEDEQDASKRYVRKPVFAHTDLRLLDRYRTVAHHLLNEKPLYDTADDKHIRVLILGFGKVGQAFFRAAVSVCAMAGYDTTFCICDREIHAQWQSLLLQYPECGSGVSVKKKQLNVESNKVLEYLDYHNRKHAPFTYIILSVGDDERNIRIASRLARHYRHMSWKNGLTHQPVICVNLENEIKSDYVGDLFRDESLKATNDYDPPIPLHVFGSDHHTFSEDMLMNRRIWCAARKLHAGLKSPDFVYWTEYERRASVACVIHAPYHVKAMKQYSTDDYDDAYNSLARQADDASVNKEQNPADASDAALNNSARQTMDAMTDAEHHRWVNHSRCEGMQGISKELVAEYKEKIGSHVDTIARLTPCMVPTGKLKDLFEDLYPNIEDTNKTRIQNGQSPIRPFKERDELVVRNAGRLTQIIKYNELEIQLFNFEDPIPQAPTSQPPQATTTHQPCG